MCSASVASFFAVRLRRIMCDFAAVWGLRTSSFIVLTFCHEAAPAIGIPL
jgi:hypothetical protein